MKLSTMPKWLPFVQYLGELNSVTNMYRQYKNVLSADVQMQPGRIIIYWLFPKTDRRAQEAREFMEAIYNLNISYLEIFKVVGIKIYEQTLSYTDFIFRVDLLVPHHFPELLKLSQSYVPWDLPQLMAALDKTTIVNVGAWEIKP